MPKKNLVVGGVVIIFALGAILLFGKTPTKDKTRVAFNCPEAFKTKEEFLNDIARFFAERKRVNPDISQTQIVNERARLFNEHNCKRHDWGEWGNEFFEAIKQAELQRLPRIRGDETLEEIYINPYILHVRTALNGYLDGSNTGVEGALYVDKENECGLSLFDKSYYRSRFSIVHAEDNEYGGVDVYIVFMHDPDTAFWAWVYDLGYSGDYVLRNFCKSKSLGLDAEQIEILRTGVATGESPSL